MNESIFRAYDIRGVYPEDFRNDVHIKLGKAFASYLIRKYGKKNPSIVVGKDNRTHGQDLQEGVIYGMLDHGAHVIKVEDCCSPMLYHAVCHGNFDGGINVTASHNPAEYNGFKLVEREAHSVAGEEIQTLKKMMMEKDFEPEVEGTMVGADLSSDYYQAISQRVKLEKRLKVVVDAGNAIAGKYYPELLKKIGCEVIELYCEQDGTFPNHQPDPIVEANTEELKRKILEEEADLGIAFDGDGDRLGIVDEKGQFHTADESFYLLIEDSLRRNQGATAVYTVSNSLIIPELIKKLGGQGKMVPVGHSFVEIAMSQSGAPIGGEQSGHFFIAEDYYGYDDAGFCAAKLCEIFSKTDSKVSELYEHIPKTVSKPELRLPCSDEQKFQVVENISQELEQHHEVNTLDGVRVDFEDGSWFGIRASNTSPKLSVLMEAHDKQALQKIEAQVSALLEKEGISMKN